MYGARATKKKSKSKTLIRTDSSSAPAAKRKSERERERERESRNNFLVWNQKVNVTEVDGGELELRIVRRSLSLVATTA